MVNGYFCFGNTDSDKFVVSLINEEGRARSVSAVSGAVVHTFNIVEKIHIILELQIKATRVLMYQVALA